MRNRVMMFCDASYETLMAKANLWLSENKIEIISTNYFVSGAGLCHYVVTYGVPQQWR